MPRPTLTSGGRVGIPGPGERLCPQCRGAGRTAADIARASHASMAGCGRCHGTGVVPELRKGDREPLPPPEAPRPAFTGPGSPSFKPSRSGGSGPRNVFVKGRETGK